MALVLLGFLLASLQVHYFTRPYRPDATLTRHYNLRIRDELVDREMHLRYPLAGIAQRPVDRNTGRLQAAQLALEIRQLERDKASSEYDIEKRGDIYREIQRVQDKSWHRCRPCRRRAPDGSVGSVDHRTLLLEAFAQGADLNRADVL